MKIIRSIWENKNSAAAATLLLWLLIPVGLVFLTGSALEYVAGFIVCYSVIYPVFTAVSCYLVSRRHGIVIFLPAAMVLLSVAGFAFTELLRYALPNVIVMTVVTVFFGCGLGNVMHGGKGDGNKNGKNNKKKENKYRSIVDD